MPKSFESDRGAQARKLHAELEKLVTTAASIEKMTAETWDALGQVLLAQRKTMPTTNAWGAWLRANRLNTGLLKNPSVISNLLWLAEHRAELQACKSYGAVHPTEVRKRHLASKALGGQERELGWDDEWVLSDLAIAGGALRQIAEKVKLDHLVRPQLVEELDAFEEMMHIACARFRQQIAKHPESVVKPEPVAVRQFTAEENAGVWKKIFQNSWCQDTHP